MKNTFLILFLPFIFSACSVKSFSLKNNVFNYEKKIDTCTFVHEIDGVNITPEMIDHEKITLPNSKTSFICPTVSDIGTYNLTWLSDSRKETQKVIIVDNEPPQIVIKKINIDVEIGSSFDVNSNFTVTDNYSTIDNIQISIDTNNFDTNTPGEYIVKITARDQTGNESTATFKIVVHLRSSESQKSNDPTNPRTQIRPPSTKTPASKRFLFSEGYNITTGMNACKEYINQYGYGSCTPIYYGHIAIGYDAKFGEN